MSAVDELVATPADSTAGTAPVPPGGTRRGRGLFDPAILGHAAADAVRKLDPRVQARNPVMFVVLIGTAVVLAESIAHPSVFAWSVTFWLVLTVLFANFAEAVAEGRGKAQADTLRQMRSDTQARRLSPDGTEERLVHCGPHLPLADLRVHSGQFLKAFYACARNFYFFQLPLGLFH